MTNLEANPRTAAATLPTTASFAALLLAWAVLLTAALVMGKLQGHGTPPATVLRMASSVVLVIFGWRAWALWRGSPTGLFARAIALGMTLGAIGDFFNAGLLRFIPLPDQTLGGIVAFGLGHVWYIAGCLYLARATGLTDRRAMVASIVAWQLIALVAWYAVVVLGSERRGLVGPALPYSLLLAGTAGVTAGLAWQDKRFGPLALGGALFLISDLILAFELFRGPFANDTECVWLTYSPGQMLIVSSVLTAARVLAGPSAPAA